MNKASKPEVVPTLTKHEAHIRALVERQARAWERNDFALAAGDWLPEGVLIAPAGEWPADRLGQAMAELHADFTDLIVEIKNVFASADGGKVAIEWDWSITRKADGVRSRTPDAIIVDLVDGKIKSWREYFDLSGSVEAVSQKKSAHSDGKL
ncbi:MAG: nuclear transport factor 2 family protein [Anaerolineae bacterium]|nr:nuclear transport factor 2 family protein [Anaerolineae bacterium]